MGGGIRHLVVRVVLRPSVRWYARNLVRNARNVANVRFLAAGILVAAIRPQIAPLVPLFLVLPVGCALGFAGLYRLRVRIVVEDETLICRGFLRTSRIRRSDIAHRVYHDYATAGEPNPILVLLAADGNRLLILHTAYWHDGALNILLWYLDIPPAAHWSQASKASVLALYPRAFRTHWRMRPATRPAPVAREKWLAGEAEDDADLVFPGIDESSGDDWADWTWVDGCGASRAKSPWPQS